MLYVTYDLDLADALLSGHLSYNDHEGILKKYLVSFISDFIEGCQYSIFDLAI